MLPNCNGFRACGCIIGISIGICGASGHSVLIESGVLRMLSVATLRRRLSVLCSAVTVLCAGAAFPVRAQVGSFGGPAGPSLTPPPVVTDRGDPFTRPGRDYGALPVGGWLLYPS